jgi:hypothetical protein
VLESHNEIRIEHNFLKTKLKLETLGTGRDARKAYAAPVLKQFGLVGALTQSGTGTSVESSANGMCSADTTRAMC